MALIIISLNVPRDLNIDNQCVKS